MKEAIEFAVTTGLSVTTIVVLVFTWRAALKQARAAEKLTVATDQQIKTGADQAEAAKAQVEVARRQITESLRPILLGSVVQSRNAPNGSFCNVTIKNDGAGVALDVWWTYGKPGCEPSPQTTVGYGIMASGVEHMFEVDEARASTEGVLILYRSLSGGDLGTGFYRNHANNYIPQYFPDLSEWCRTLLGRVVGQPRR